MVQKYKFQLREKPMKAKDSISSNQLALKNAETLMKYYEKTNVGDFKNALQFLSEDVVYTVSGNPAIQPFAGEWIGRSKVINLFQKFGELFWLVYMDEILTVTGANEVFSFNDEQFKVKHTKLFYRLGVVHHITFTKDGLINSLSNIHDTYPPDQAFAGQPAIVEPMLPKQFHMGDTVLSDVDSANFIEQFYKDITAGAAIDDYLAENANALIPGDPTTIPFSGYWFGKDQVKDYYTIRNKILEDREFTTEQILANNNNVVAVTNERVKLKATTDEVKLYSITLFQLTENCKIGRISVFMDTLSLHKLISGE
jgi:ketosteroid isomerase-like protein